MIFKTSVSQWAATPVITTINTIRAHVSEIQFPTVTVCPEVGTPPNNWGYVQTLLDQLPYNCPLNDDDDCTDALMIKNDIFGFVFKAILRTIDKYVDNIDETTLEVFISSILNSSKAPEEGFNDRLAEELPPLQDTDIRIDDLSKKDIWFIARTITENHDHVFGVPKFGQKVELLDDGTRYISHITNIY